MVKSHRIYPPSVIDCYQAIFARKECGCRLTMSFLVSSKQKIIAPNPTAGHTYFTGTGAVRNVELNHPTCVRKTATKAEHVTLRQADIDSCPSRKTHCAKRKTHSECEY
jgi:hypothetical protein